MGGQKFFLWNIANIESFTSTSWVGLIVFNFKTDFFFKTENDNKKSFIFNFKTVNIKFSRKKTLKLSQQGMTTTGYQRGDKTIPRSASMKDPMRFMTTKVLTSDFMIF